MRRPVFTAYNEYSSDKILKVIESTPAHEQETLHQLNDLFDFQLRVERLCRRFLSRKNRSTADDPVQKFLDADEEEWDVSPTTFRRNWLAGFLKNSGNRFPQDDGTD